MALNDITVKTLDGQNRTFSVPEQMTVRSFKEKISNSIEIPAETQRLIFHGRVMQDEKELKDYDIHGKAVHVVQRAPPSTTNTGESGTQSNPPQGTQPINVDGNLLDVQIHFGGMNTAATTRDARQRIRQAEINIGIVNNALDLMEQRIGIHGSQSAEEEVGNSTAGQTESTQQENMDSSPPLPTQTTGDSNPQEGVNETRDPSSSSSSQSQQPTGNQRQDSQQGLSATELADFLDRVLVTSQRITPHLILYRNYLHDEETYPPSSQEARNAQEVANRVMEAVHAMSHVMHNLSDVMVDMHSPFPQQATAVPMSPFAMPGTNTMAIPIHMNLRARPPGTNGNRGRGSTAQPQQPPASAPESRPGTEASTNPPPPNDQQPATMNLDGVQVLGEPVVTVHNIQATVLTDDMELPGGMNTDGSGAPYTTGISVVSANTPIPSQQQQPTATSTATSSATSTRVTSGVTSSGSSTSTTRSTTSASTNATAGFTMGPTTNVNIGSTGLGSLPNVPGLPGGMLQNIVQSILNNHGVQAGHPVQVNVVHPAGLAGVPHIHHHHQQPTGQRPPVPISTAQSRATFQPQQPSSTNSTTPTTSHTTSGSNRGGSSGPRPAFIGRGGRPSPYGMGPRQARPTGVGPQPGNGPPNNRGFMDLYLPCNSHHYLSQTARRTARMSRQQGQQQQVPNLSTMVSGMVGDLLGPAHVHQQQHTRNNANRSTSDVNTSAPVPPPRTTSIRGGQSQNTAGLPGFDPEQMLAAMIGGIGGGPVQFDQASLFRSMMGGNVPNPAARNTSANPGNNNNTPTNNSTTASAGVGVTPVVNPIAGGTLADLFRQFSTQIGRSTNESEPSEPSFVQALIETVAPHIRLTDLFSLVMGNTRVIGQVRGPLQQFAQSRVTQHGSVQNVVNSAIDDMDSEITFVTNCVEVRPGVNMIESLRNCLRHHLQKVIDAILSESPASGDEYGQALFNLWMTMLAEVVAVCIYCIRNGEEGFESMLEQYMPNMTRDLNPAITVWMTTSVRDILSSFHRNHAVPEENILRFVQSTESAASSASQQEKGEESKDSSSNAVQPASSSELQSNIPPSTHSNVVNKAEISARPGSVPMEVTESPPSQPPRPKVPRTQQAKEIDSSDEFVDAPEEFTSRPAAVPKTSRPTQIGCTSASKGTEGLTNGEASNQWQNVIPQEWIPVISQDIEKQKEQRSQPPLSDAYLQGLPAKRRRMMVLEHAGEVGNMPQYLPSAINRAARAAGVEPISSQQNMMQEASEEKELHNELENEVQAVVESRIMTDRDFNSDRFPNSIRYFQKSKDP